MSDNLAVSWSFTNRILLGDKKLQSDEDQQLLHVSGSKKIALMVLLGHKFTDADSLILRGDGFESSDEAYAAGRLWRQYVTIAFAIGRLGADFDPLPRTSRHSDDRPPDPAAPGLVVFRVKQSDLRLEGWASGSVYRPLRVFLDQDLPPVIKALPNGLQNRPDLELAFRMFHLSMQSDNVDIRYILLVTALEALVPSKMPEKQDQALISGINALIEIAKEPQRLPTNIRDTIVSKISEFKKDSISGFGAKLADQKLAGRQYDGISPGEYFRRAYSRRSSLVHGNLSDGVPLDRQVISKDLDTLPNFVGDLLAAEAGYPV